MLASLVHPAQGQESLPQDLQAQFKRDKDLFKPKTIYGQIAEENERAEELRLRRIQQGQNTPDIRDIINSARAKKASETAAQTNRINVKNTNKLELGFVTWFIVGALAMIGVLVVKWWKDLVRHPPEAIVLSSETKGKIERGFIFLQGLWGFVTLVIAGTIDDSLLSVETITGIACLASPIWAYHVLRWIFQPSIMSLRMALGGTVLIIIVCLTVKVFFAYQLGIEGVGMPQILMIFAFWLFRGIHNLLAGRNVLKDDFFLISGLFIQDKKRHMQ